MSGNVITSNFKGKVLLDGQDNNTFETRTNGGDQLEISVLTLFFTLFISLFSYFVPVDCYAQTANVAIDSIVTNIQRNNPEKNSSILFSHFDKNIYSNNEDVWFTTYLLNYNKRINNPSILSVLLVKNIDKSIELQRHFVMRDGLSFGHLLIPEGCKPGDYSFVVYTNVLINGEPSDKFVQDITIKMAIRPRLSLILNQIQDSNGRTLVSAKLTFPDGSPVIGGDVHYTFGALSGDAKTDQTGQYLFKVPSFKSIGDKLIFHVEAKFNREENDAYLRLMPVIPKMCIHFFPEGGQLIFGIASIVGLEVKTVDGKPLKVKAILYNKGKVVDTIQTDKTGLSRFKVFPEKSSAYNIRVIGGLDTSYLLPRPLDHGAVITINDALCNDSLRVKFFSDRLEKLFVIIHDNTQVSNSFAATTGPGGKNILINLQQLARGLHTITVLDTIGRPIAERLFFAHYGQGASVNISTDQDKYNKRQKIKLKLEVLDNVGKKTNGLVSIACVAADRIDPLKMDDIESYSYLNTNLGSLSFHKRIDHEPTNKIFFENVLLIKGWRKYTWQVLQTNNNLNKVLKSDTNDLWYGTITRHNTSVKAPVNLLLINDSVTHVITTDKAGHFSLNEKSLYLAEDKVIQIRASNNRDYTFFLRSKFDSINSLVVSNYQPMNFAGEDVTSSNNYLPEPRLHRVINLKGVIIKGGASRREDGSLYSEKGPNKCGDYVCRENVLNCPIHFGNSENRPAREGGTYGIMTNHNGQPTDPPIINGRYVIISNFINFQNDTYDVVEYKGCLHENKNSTIKEIDGIYSSKEFYPVDFSKNDNLLPVYQTTLFWKHSYFLSSKHDNVISFFSNDSQGRFKIIVQGITNDDKIYAEKDFNVLP